MFLQIIFIVFAKDLPFLMLAHLIVHFLLFYYILFFNVCCDFFRQYKKNEYNAQFNQFQNFY